MPISARCGHCGKSYEVSRKFAGKKAKCTACGKAFAIPAGVAPAAGGGDDDLLAGLAQAAEAERGASEAPAAGAPGQVTQKSSGGCASCGAAMDAGSVVCIECGYDSRTKAKARTVVERPAAGPLPRRSKAARGGRGVERDASGVRYNRPYGNAVLRTLDGLLAILGTLAFAVIWVWLYRGLRRELALGPSSTTGDVLAIIGTIVVAIEWYGVTMGMGAIGAFQAAKWMRFELPERMFGRICSIVVVGDCLWLLGFYFALPAQFYQDNYRRIMLQEPSIQIEWALRASLALAFLWIVMLCIQYPVTWLVLRLRALEALVANVVIGGFALAGFCMSYGIFLLIMEIISSMVSKPHH